MKRKPNKDVRNWTSMEKIKRVKRYRWRIAKELKEGAQPVDFGHQLLINLG